MSDRSESDISRTSSAKIYDGILGRSRGSRRSLIGGRGGRGGGGGGRGSPCMSCFGSRRPKASTEEPLSISYSNDATSSSYCSRSGASYTSKDVANKVFSMREIQRATGNFAANNIIGQGQFVTTYKGTLKDGTVVAVKRADKSLSNRSVSNEFKNEIQTLSKIEHLNLVRCFDYLEQDGEIVIIFEYVGNGNLQEHLDGSRGVEWDIAARIEIAIDVAHAITYLHSYSDYPIIHRNIKASNILITENFRAKVSDFGLAHLAPDSADATHVFTQVKGTEGYIDPEYVQTYELTEKSDVYSFGVLLVELVTGRHPIEARRPPKERMTVRWAMQRHKAGDSVMTMDPRLRRSPASVMAVEKLLDLAYQCLDKSRKTRPSMKQCAEVLWGIRKRYKEVGILKDNVQLNSTSASYCKSF